MRAWELLGVEVAASASAETDPRAMRVVRARWPAVQEWGDMRVVDEAKLLAFRASAVHLKILIVARCGWTQLPCSGCSR